MTAISRGSVDLLSDTAIGIHGFAAKEAAAVMGKNAPGWTIDAITAGAKYGKGKGFDALLEQDEEDERGLLR